MLNKAISSEENNWNTLIFLKKIKKSPDVCSGQRHCMKHSALIAVLSLHRICGRASHQVVFSDDKTRFPASLYARESTQRLTPLIFHSQDAFAGWM